MRWPVRCVLLGWWTVAAASASAQALRSTGFDDLAADGFGLRAEPGHAAIDPARGVADSPCLRVLGGPARTVELWLAAALDAPFRLRLRAERWTQREPFACRLLVDQGGGFRELADLTAAIRVGRALTTAVELPLDPSAPLRALRLVVTSPADTGLLLDDLRLEARAPRRARGVEPVAWTGPVLRSRDAAEPADPVAMLDVVTVGNDGPIELEAVTIEVGAATDPAALDDLALVAIAGDGARTALARLDRPTVGRHDLDLRAALDADRPRLVLEARARATADLDGRIVAGFRSVRCRGAAAFPVAAPLPSQRLGVALRRAGDDGVHTHRIPGLATTPGGTLLAVYDLRHANAADLPGDIDVALQRSTDGGHTWSAPVVILDAGPPHAANGVGDPCVLVDDVTGRAFVFGLWSSGDRGWHGSGPGLTPDETGQLLVTTSDDDGVTWSAPRNLTAAVKDPSWRLLLQGPGRGITTRDGVLVAPAQFRDHAGVPHATVLWSDDRGATWQVGTGARPHTTEAAVVELGDGQWLLNCRDDRGGSRAVLVTSDRGASWREHPTSRRALPEPVCMASLIGVPAMPGDDRDHRRWLAFANPAVAAPPRRAITLRLSDDDGATWPAARAVLLDLGTSYGYSCLTVVSPGTLGILYESSRAQLVFQRVPLAPLADTDGR